MYNFGLRSLLFPKQFKKQYRWLRFVIKFFLRNLLDKLICFLNRPGKLNTWLNPMILDSISFLSSSNNLKLDNVFWEFLIFLLRTLKTLSPSMLIFAAQMLYSLTNNTNSVKILSWKGKLKLYSYLSFWLPLDAIKYWEVRSSPTSYVSKLESVR